MGSSRSSKDQMNMNGSLQKKPYAEGGDVDHWMQDVHPKKGALHREMHIPSDQKISTQRLEKATHAQSPLLRKRANLALRYRGD